MSLDVLSKLAGGRGRMFANLRSAALVQAALVRGEGELSDDGALVVRTGAKTGRSPDDKYVVGSPMTDADVWFGNVNHRIGRDVFDALLDKALTHLRERDTFVFDGYGGADARHRLPLRVVTEKAWHNLFARTLFVRPTADELASIEPQFHLINAGSLPAGGAAAGVRSDTFIGIDFDRGVVLILGTEYAGEMKKAIFSVLNYLLPRAGLLSMHCSANVGATGDAALFFGLSGTGKTTLSADPTRRLIGDDETGWSEHGIFNLEGGCYAKCINLSRDAEPQIYDAIRFGSVLENVIIDPVTRRPDYANQSLTENTRATYPLMFIPGAVIPSVGPHPNNILFLTADAFGVLPPVAKLTPAQAMYHYISGYTAKVAGTETGVTEPKATFSPCFGGPFLPLHPMRYASLLGERIAKHGVNCWLVNTGWTGGPYGVGQRMKIAVSRAVVTAILSGALEGASFTADSVFRVLVPDACPGVPPALLRPRTTWPDANAYDAKAREVAGLFAKNFQTYSSACTPEVREAGPALG